MTIISKRSSLCQTYHYLQVRKEYYYERAIKKVPSKKRGYSGVFYPLYQEGGGGVFSMKVNYHPKPKERARNLRNNGTKSEVKPWQHLKNKKMMGYDFHR